MELQNIDIGNVLVSVTGLSLNMLTIISLLMMRSTRQVLGMLTWSLVLALSASDLLITGFFLPLKVWNHVVGDCWPFSVSGVCLLIEFMWILVAAVAWLLVMVAVVRTIAVFAPLFFRKCAENVWFRVVLVVFPFVFAFGFKGWYFVSGSITVKPVNGTGLCFPDSTSPNFTSYQHLDMLGPILAYPIGAFLYLLIILRLRRIRVNTSRERVDTMLKQSESLNRIRICAILHLVNLVLVWPNAIVFSFGLKEKLVEEGMPVLETMVMLSSVVNPMVLFLVSRDLRKAYLLVFKEGCRRK